MAEKIIIELSERDAELFKWFRQYQGIWEEARGLSPGSLVLHFDKDNKLKKREFHYYDVGTIDKPSGDKI